MIRVRKKRKAHRNVVGKFEGKVQIGKKIRLEGRIILKWVLRDIGWEETEWFNLPQDRDNWRLL
jgi:hypothetical protein